MLLNFLLMLNRVFPEMIFNAFTDKKNQESKGFDQETFWMVSKHLNHSIIESKVTDRIFKFTLMLQ